MSGSIKYLSKVIEVLDVFLTVTSMDDFWAQHKTNLRVIPFTTLLKSGDMWDLDYATFTSASQLRSSEKNGLTKFRDNILAKGV